MGSFNKRVPFGSTVIFELHQKYNTYLIKIYYLNDSYTEQPHLLNIGICNCQSQCLIDQFYQGIQEFFIKDFDEECANTNTSIIYIITNAIKSGLKHLPYITFYIFLLVNFFYFFNLIIKKRRAKQ